MVAEVTGAKPTKPVGMRPVASGRVELTVEISEELAAKIREARDLLSHIEGGDAVEFVIERAVTKLVEIEKKRRFGVGNFPGVKKAGLSPRNDDLESSDVESSDVESSDVESSDVESSDVESADVESTVPAGRARKRALGVESHLPEGTRGRYIPIAVRRQVYERAQGRCEFVGREGRRCGCTALVEIDHVDSFCEGGDNTAENLRLLCDPHNRYLAEMMISGGAATRKRIEFRGHGSMQTDSR